MTEPHESCIGYNEEGKPLFSDAVDSNESIEMIQEYALGYMEKFSSVFQDELAWLPVQFADACLPFECFLHSPKRSEKRWMQNYELDNDAGDGLHLSECSQIWRTCRTDYWIAKHCLGKYGRHAVRFIMLSIYNRNELKRLVLKRMPNKHRRQKDS